MREVYNTVLSEKNVIINELIDMYKKCAGATTVAKNKHKTQSEISALLAKKEKLLDLVTDGRITDEEFEQRNGLFNTQLSCLKAKLSGLDEEEKQRHSLAETAEKLRSYISEELDFTENTGKNVIDSFVDRIVVHSGENKHFIRLEIYLKILPGANQVKPDSFCDRTVGSGRIITTRGGNSRAVKAYNMTFDYLLFYCPK
jgi:hypothetical protein